MGCSSSALALGVQEDSFHEKYCLSRKLGEGSFGQVRLATERASGKSCVVKIIDARSHHFAEDDGLTAWNGSMDFEKVSDARKEFQVWRRLGKNPNCVELYSVFFDSGMYFAVMERCESSLFDKMEDMHQATEPQMGRMFREMLLGIQHVHQMSVVHRDIKPDNFLYGLDGVVKLADFGLATVLANGGLGAGGLSGAVGTLPYMSPEMLVGSKYGQKTDVWSLGVTAYLMLYGEFPYGPELHTPAAMKACIISGRPKPTYLRAGQVGKVAPHQPLSNCATGFIQSLLERAVCKRCTAFQALAHPFVDPVEKSSSVAPKLVWTDEKTDGGEVKPFVKMVRAQTRIFENKQETSTLEGSSGTPELDTVLLKLQEERGALKRCFSMPVGEGSALLPAGEEEGDMAGQPSATSPRRSRSRCDLSSTAKGAETPSTSDGEWVEDAWNDNDDEPEDSTPLPLPRLPPCQPSTAKPKSHLRSCSGTTSPQERCALPQCGTT